MEESGAAGDSSANVQIPDKTKLIVNYIPQLASEEELHAMFSQVGVVENVRIMRDNRTGYSYGFGFVKYTSPQFAEAAIAKFNGMQFKNKRLKVSYSRPPSQEMKDSNLYITNLPKETTEYELHELFKQYGTIVQKTLLKDKYSGMPRGVAFVRFSCHSEAQAAIESLNGKHLENAMHPLSVRVAEDHGRQKAQFIEQFANSHVHMCCNREPQCSPYVLATFVPDAALHSTDTLPVVSAIDVIWGSETAMLSTLITCFGRYTFDLCTGTGTLDILMTVHKPSS